MNSDHRSLGNGDDPLIDAQEVARLLDMSVDYVWKLCRENRIPHLRFGRNLRFRRSAVLDWFAQLERSAGVP
jgi:excisionase family DNA binding protein